jgi:hypothetical protein
LDRSAACPVLGAAIFSLFLERRWAMRDPGRRVVRFCKDSERQIEASFSVPDTSVRLSYPSGDMQI